MFGTNNSVAVPIQEPGHSFERSIIFIPKWLEKRVQTFGKNDKTLKDIDGLFSILIPADVSFYLSQVAAISQHPAIKPYFQSFNMFSYADAASWGANISSKKASKKYNEIMEKLQRGSEANNVNNFLPLDSYVENNTDTYGKPAQPDVPELTFNHTDLAGILGVNANDPEIDLYNIRVIIEELDANTLILRVGLLDPNQSKIGQVLSQTEANIKKITQYYEFNKVAASPVGKYYFRLVLASPNS